MRRALVPLAVVSCALLAFGQNPLATTPPTTYVPTRIVQAVDENHRVTLKGNTHPLARPQFDIGGAPPDLPMQRMLLVLKRSPEQQTALKRLLDAQQDKASPNYHRWLTPEKFGVQFGPSDADLQTVRSWLQTHGFQIEKIAKAKNIIEFSGNAAQVEETFSTPIHKYAIRGKEHWANAADPQIPAALAPVVGGVFTLHDFRKKPMLKVAPEPVLARYVKGQPVATFGSPAVHALAPADYAKIYNINPTYNSGVTGIGQTIAVVGRTNLYNSGFGTGSDITDFQNIFGNCCIPVSIVLNGPDPGDLGGGEEAEATLDATWSGALAPNATVDFVVSASTNTTDGVDLSELYIIDNNLAGIITESFSTCELQPGIGTTEAAGIAALAEQAAAQGITYIVSSGDSGAEGCDDPNLASGSGVVSVNILAATPYTLAVGGTQFNENGQDNKYWSSTNGTTFGSALSYIPEDVWNESCTTAQCSSNAGLWATGGGSSYYFGKPSWQTGFGDAARDVPDVSLTAASHDPYLLCLEGSCVPDVNGFFSVWLISGTSAAAPSFAGIMALVDQKMSARQGQANYVLYRLAATNPTNCNGSSPTTLPGTGCVFNDITLGNNAVPGESGYGTSAAKYQSGKGYDLATGLGSVNVSNLVSKWNSVTFNPTTTTLVLNGGSNVNVPHGTPVSYSVTVAPQSSSGSPTGDVALIENSWFTRSIDLFKLSGSAASGQTSLLPGGSYQVTAHYGGDGTYAGSDSSPTTVTIGQEPSTTTLQVAGSFDSVGNIVPFTSGPYGSFMYLRADVKGQSGVGYPTGSVMFSEDSTSLGSYSLNSLGNTATPNGFFTVPVGTHNLWAQYLSDQSFSSSTSGNVSITITQASTSGSLKYTGATQGANLTATVASGSGGAPPSGTVSFTVDGQSVGSPVGLTGIAAVTNPFLYIFSGARPVLLGASAFGTLSDSALPNGPHTVIATYSGDANYSVSTSAPFVFNLQPDFAFTSTDNVINIPVVGSSGGLQLTVSSLDNFTGSVSFACSGLPAESTCSFSPSSVKGSGTTMLTISTVAPRAKLEMHRSLQLWLGSSMGIAGVMFAGVSSKRKLKWMRLMLFVFMFLAVGCGGGGGSSPTTTTTHDPGTAAGTYAVAVNAGSGSIVHQLKIQLVIQ